MAFKQLVEKRAELDAATAKLQKALDESKTDNPQVRDLDLIKSIEGTQAEKLDAIRKMGENVTALGIEVDALVLLETTETNLAKAHDVKGGTDAARFSTQEPGEPSMEGKGIGDLFVASEAYKGWKPGVKGHRSSVIHGGAIPALKTDFTTSAGWAPESLRTGRVVLDAQRPIQVFDSVPGGNTGSAAIVYMEETTFTNAAAARAESAAYAEATLALTERSSTVRSVGTSLPVTDEQLADEAQVASYLNARLGFMVRQTLDQYILTGSGSAPILLGFNNLTGVLTQAKGGDDITDAFYRAMRQVRTTGQAMPSVCYINPTDWEGVRLLRSNDGLYIWGNPSEAGPLRLWGVNVIEAQAQTQGTGLVGDVANFTQLFMRQDLTVELGFVDDDFLDGRQTIRAGIRAALVGYRPAAFCQVTGL